MFQYFKKITGLLLCVAILFSFSACKIKNNTYTDESITTTTPKKDKENITPSIMHKTSAQNDKYIYSMGEQGIVLEKYIGQDTEVITPQSIDGVTVTEIGKDCFAKNENITSVELSRSLKTVNTFAFYNCTNLKKLTIRNGVKTICGSAFADCSSLEIVVFPESVEEIKECAFINCTNLSSVTFQGERELTIGASAFSNTPLKRLFLPEGTKSISNAAFYNCKNLKEVIVPKSITKIENNAFKKSPKVVLYVQPGSYGVIFANTAGEKYKIQNSEN